MNLKTTVNWRQIIKTPPFEYCNGMKVGGIIPFVENRIEAFKTEYPGLPFVCTMQPGNYSANHTYNYPHNAIVTRINVTQITVTKPTKSIKFYTNESGFKVMGIQLPNGVYGNCINFTTKADPAGFQVNFQFEWRKRLGEEQF
jgi:hypothetical protein